MHQAVQPLSARNRWLAIWTQPRAVVRDVIDTDPEEHVHLIPLIGGILVGLGGSWLDLLISIVLVFLVFYFIAFLVRCVGSCFGGVGRGEEVRAALVWGGFVPGLQFGLMFSLIISINTVLGNPLATLGNAGSTLLISLSTALCLWTTFVSLGAIAEAHQFSSVKALLTQASVIAICALIYLFYLLMLPLP